MRHDSKSDPATRCAWRVGRAGRQGKLAGLSLMLGLAAAWAAPALAEEPVCAEKPTAGNQAPLTYTSVEPQIDGRYRFRLCAPLAHDVHLMDGDIFPPSGMAQGEGAAMAKDAEGYWSVVTAKPVGPGTYSFAFKVDGVTVPDPQGVSFSEGWRGVHSVFEAKGEATAFQSYDPAVPHGLVATFDYSSTSLGILRRAHVYLPPGYEGGGSRRYPVLYLVHGAGGSDDSWTAVGHANLILDNLIAAGKAEPMIIVMPFGHTPGGKESFKNTDFGADLVKDLVPYVDGHFRTLPTAKNRAMAGLSMGGGLTLRFGVPHPETFGQVGIFSMGLYQPDQDKAYVALEGPGLKQRALSDKPVFFAMGKDDFLHPSVGPTRKVFDDYKIRYVYRESEGGHVWPNWRAYLAEFAPTLFR